MAFGISVGWAQSSTDNVYPSDITTPEGMVNAFYQTVSGPPGERNWDRFRGLFLPDAQINAVNYTEDDSSFAVYGSVEDYITNTKPFFEEWGVDQREMKTSTELYGNSAQIFSSYYVSYFHADEQQTFEQQGVASFQLAYLKNRWWIVNLLWNSENPNNPLPEELVKIPVERSHKTATVPYDQNHVFRASEVDVPPSYPGGVNELIAQFRAETKMPKAGQEANVSGEVTLEIIVEEDGGISEAKVTGSLGYGCDEEALRVVKNLPVWEPGVNNYESVRVALFIRVPFDSKTKTQ